MPRGPSPSTSGARPTGRSSCAVRGFRRGIPTGRAARCPPRLPPTSPTASRQVTRCGRQSNISKARSVMRRRSARGTDRSTICGGYTEKVAGFLGTARSQTGSDALFQVTPSPLDVSGTTAAVSSSECGAVATFVGLVRDHNAGRRVLYLDYECYEPLAIKAFARIATEAGTHWPGARLAIDHRVGPLQIGEASVVISAASPHRADAFAACRFAIERI